MGTGGYGRLIHEAREKKGLSQSRLAEKVFVNSRTVSRWETERTRPSGESMKLLAMVLQIPLEDLEAAVAASSTASSGAGPESPHQAGAGARQRMGKAPAGRSGRPETTRRRPLTMVLAALAAVAVIAALSLQPSLTGGGENSQAGSTPSDQFAEAPSPVVSAIPAGAVAKAVLGRDLKPEEVTPCGGQNVGPGADWVFGPATLGGVEYDAAFRCSLSGGSSGELTFRLDKKYSRVQLVMGLLSAPGGGSVRFAVLRDGMLTPMTPFELESGGISTLDYSVDGVFRLSIRLAGTGSSGTGVAPATPVVASLMLF